VASLDRIRRVLLQTRIRPGIGNENDWAAEFFQAANGMAHLHFLRDLCGEEASLEYVCFVDGPDVPKAAAQAQWQGALDLLDAYPGATNHRPKPFKATAFSSPIEDLPTRQAGAQQLRAGCSARRLGRYGAESR
jgi:hypothetical protein